jgi:hypothetical protein
MKRNVFVIRKDKLSWGRRIKVYLPEASRFRGTKSKFFPLVTIGCFLFSATSFTELYKSLMKFKKSNDVDDEIDCRVLSLDTPTTGRYYKKVRSVRKIGDKGIRPLLPTWPEYLPPFFDSPYIKWEHLDRCMDLIKSYKGTF